MDFANYYTSSYVLVIDINPLAVDATRTNAQLNGLSEHISVLKGDVSGLWDLGKGGFDFIVSNPPHYRSDPLNMSERAFKGGAKNEFMTSLASAVTRLLRPGGSLLFVLSSDVDPHQVFGPLERRSFSICPLEMKQLMLETLTSDQVSHEEVNGETAS